MSQVTYGYKIKEARKKASMTQKELSEKAGISINSIKKYETTDRVPKMETIKKIAEALGINFIHLIPIRGEEDDGFVYLDEESLETLKGFAESAGIDPYERIEDIPEDTDPKLRRIRVALSKVFNAEVKDLLSDEHAKELEAERDSLNDLMNANGINTLTTDQWVMLGLTYLNEKGKKKALEYITDLCDIEQYTKEDN